MDTTDTTDPPTTLADELRLIADYFEVGQTPERLAAAADVLDIIGPDLLALAARIQADVDAHPLPDGWTATVHSHQGVLIRHDDYPLPRSSIFVACIAADDFAWSVKLHEDDDEWATAATLADVVTAHLAVGR